MKELPLTRGLVAIIDDEDFELVGGFKWCAMLGRYTHYAKRAMNINGVHHSILLHRVIAKAPDGMCVDHINGNGLDNRRANLRLCTHSNNQHNRRMTKTNHSGYRGVSRSYDNRWEAQIAALGKRYHIGKFKTPEEAARAYDKRAKELHGEFARVNFA